MFDTNAGRVGSGATGAQEHAAEVNCPHWLGAPQNRGTTAEDGGAEIDCLHWLEGREDS